MNPAGEKIKTPIPGSTYNPQQPSYTQPPPLNPQYTQPPYQPSFINPIPNINWISLSIDDKAKVDRIIKLLEEINEHLRRLDDKFVRNI